MPASSTSTDLAREVEDRLITCGFRTEIDGADDDATAAVVRAWKTVDLDSGEQRDEEFVIEIRKTKGA